MHFSQGSKEFADKKSIINLAEELSSKYNAPIEITIEFEKIEKDNLEQSIKLPLNKSLPIVGPD